METKGKKSKDSCQENRCFSGPEDALLDLNKMTPEELKGYLYSLLRDRSFGC